LAGKNERKISERLVNSDRIFLKMQKKQKSGGNRCCDQFPPPFLSTNIGGKQGPAIRKEQGTGAGILLKLKLK